MKKILLVIVFPLILIYTNQIYAQQWIKYFGGTQEDKVYAITVDNSGYIYAAGYSTISGHGTDFITLKIDPTTGSAVWTKYYDGPASQDDKVYAIKVDKLNNVYVCGSSTGPGTGTDMTVVKYSPNGTQQWVGRYNSTTNGDDAALGIAVDDSLNVYLTGYVSLIGYDMYIIKFNSLGTIQWGRFYGGTSNEDDKAYAIELDSYNSVFIGGYTVNNSTNSDYTLIRYNRSNGDVAWVKKYDAPIHLNDIAVCMALSEANHIYLSGYTEENQDDVNFLTVRFNVDNGQIDWAKKYNGSGNGNDKVYAITVDKFDNVFITGSVTSMARTNGVLTYNQDYKTLKYNPSGDTLWTASFDYNLADDIAKRMCLSSSGEFLFVTGTTMKNNTPDSQDIATIKYNALTGQRLQTSIIKGAGNGDDDVYGIAVDSLDDAFLAGYMTNVSNNIDLFVSKYYRGDLIDVKNISSTIPRNFQLYQNYPNPFNPATIIKFDVKQSGIVRLAVYDLLGRTVDILVNENLRAGSYEISYSSSKLASGVYFYEMTSGDYRDIKKMMLIK